LHTALVCHQGMRRGMFAYTCSYAVKDQILLRMQGFGFAQI